MVFSLSFLAVIICLYSLTCLNIFLTFIFSCLTYISSWWFFIWFIKLTITYIDIVTNINILLHLSLINFMTSTKHDNQIIIIHSFAFGGRGYFSSIFRGGKYFSSVHPKFDKTCGFPGEGPKKRPCPFCAKDSGKVFNHRGPCVKLTSEERRKVNVNNI